MALVRSNFLILGSGVAGLKTALNAARFGTVTVITKKEDFESNTNYAQGGIATVLDTKGDSFDNHIRDTLQVGAGLCHPDSVSLIVTRGPREIEELIRLGWNSPARMTAASNWAEGGHSRRRIVHAKDLTGARSNAACSTTPVTTPTSACSNITFPWISFSMKTAAAGAPGSGTSQRTMHLCLAGVTILATGGCGLVYLHSTNPSIATGDGVAMAFARARASPTWNSSSSTPAPSTRPAAASRPFSFPRPCGGGRHSAHPRRHGVHGEIPPAQRLGPRDVVARAIDYEMKNRGDKCCFLDVTHIDQGFFHRRFPYISSNCEKAGLHLAKDWIPIVPPPTYIRRRAHQPYRRHRHRGTLLRGEAASTGVHGANRLASNSILEALVFSTLAAKPRKNGDTPRGTARLSETYPQKPNPGKLEAVRLVNCRHSIRCLMWDYVGIVRANSRLQQARKRLEVLTEEIDSYFQAGHINDQLLELRNLAQTAELIILSALQRGKPRPALQPRLPQLGKRSKTPFSRNNRTALRESVPIPRPRGDRLGSNR